MHTHFEAVFEDGVFKPLHPVDLPEHLLVRIQIYKNDAMLLAAEDQAQVVLSADRWQAFCDALDAPARDIPVLRKLLTSPSVLEEQRRIPH